MFKTTRTRLQERHDTPLVMPTSAESLNAMSLQHSRKDFAGLTKTDSSKPCFHSGSGCNTKCGSMSPKYSVFVLDKQGKPLTPTTPSKARKMLNGLVAESVWNKFGRMGIQMLVDTRKETPKTALGVDFGTKFEGYAVVVGKENNLSVMWKLPDKKKIVKKMEKRRQLRRARRWRTCRRRRCRFDNRKKTELLAPSQKVIVQSRMKVISEFFRCYSINAVAMEDVNFNHRDNRWGENFSTMEIGKTQINRWIRQRSGLTMFTGNYTGDCRARYGYKKSSNKGAETFNAHCSDALAIATDLYAQEHITQGKFIIADDTYRPVRRQLHDTQPSKAGIREKYSSGNFKGVRKGTICNFGKICGGTKDKTIRTYNWKKERLSKPFSQIIWLSHKFNAIDVRSGDSLIG